MSRGYLIVAQNSGSIDYIKCARVLCWSIKNTDPTSDVTLLTNIETDIKPFDRVILFPWGDISTGDWKLDNDWQAYWASPYDETLKIEADIYLPCPVEHWWNILGVKDLVVCNTIRDHRGNISNNRFYRKTFDSCGLPDLYSGLTYFKKSVVAGEFFTVVKNIFSNWGEWKKLVGVSDQVATTDVVYAIAAKIIGVENCTLPTFKEFSMVHMKQHIVDSITVDWTKDFIYEVLPDTLRINTIPQLYPFHYHIKNFATVLAQELCLTTI